MAPTIRDVAIEAGVSPMTVSNVLNGRTHRATPATAERVMAAVRKLGYVPSAAARALSRRSTQLVALLLPAAPGGDTSLLNAHDSLFVSEVERYVSAAKRHLLLHAPTNLVTAADEVLRTWNVDGTIILGAFGEQIESLATLAPTPLVLVDSYSTVPTISSVGLDDYGGGYLAGEELCRLGHRSIGFVGPRRDLEGVTLKRYLGFSKALSDHGATIAPHHVLSCEATFEDGIRVSAELSALEDRPTAVFATTDMAAAGLVKGLQSHGIRVPEELSIIGFDDLPVARYVTPELTTIRQDIPAKARESVELLLSLLGDPPSEGQRRTLSVELVRRASCAPPSA